MQVNVFEYRQIYDLENLSISNVNVFLNNVQKCVKMHKNAADSYKAGETVNLLGYTSTSKRFGSALKFAYKDLHDDQIPVVFEIIFQG